MMTVLGHPLRGVLVVHERTNTPPPSAVVLEVGFDVMASLVTFELGSVTPRPNAQTTYDGPWVQHDWHEVSLADGEQDLMILPFRLDPGTYRVVAQVTAREVTGSR
jgi:hypothetical protein